ncbi:MAG: response regulator transcription factor [Pseudomonadota bacterium]
MLADSSNIRRDAADAVSILVVEDDPQLNRQLVDALSDQKYVVVSCADGEQGLVLATSQRYDLILLDVMLPKLDGLSVLNILRRTSETPVIIVSARHAEEERIKGLSAGADDYLSKPFNIEELLLRIDAVLRRSLVSANDSEDQLELDDLMIDRKERSAKACGQLLELTPTQLNLLWTLARNLGEVLPRAYLYQAVLNRSHSAYDRSLDMHLSRVRRKLNAAGWDGSRLRTVHGKGYCLT